jgi:hypothetical protein
VTMFCGNLVPDPPYLVDFVITHRHHHCLGSSEAWSKPDSPVRVQMDSGSVRRVWYKLGIEVSM